MLIIDSIARRHKTSIKNVEWKDDVDLPVEGKPESFRDFYDLYGDSFVSSVTTGARFYMAISINATSQEEADSTKAQLGVSANIKGMPVKADTKVGIANFLKNTNLDISVLTKTLGIGGTGQEVDPDRSKSKDEVTELLNYAFNLQTKPLPEPAIIERVFSGYENVKGGKMFRELSRNREIFYEVGGPMSLAQFRNECRKKIELITAVHEVFGNFQDEGLNRKREKIEADCEALRGVFRAYTENPGLPVKVPEMKFKDRRAPELQFTSGSSDTWGMRSGQDYRFQHKKSWRDQPWRISKIRLAEVKDSPMFSSTIMLGDIAVCFEEIYVNNEGAQFREMEWQSLRLLGDSNKFHQKREYTLSRNAILHEVSGHCGAKMDSIKMVFSDGNTPEAGTVGGGHFYSWNWDSQKMVTGMSASANSEAPLSHLELDYIVFTKIRD